MKKNYSALTKKELLDEIERLNERLVRIEKLDTNYRPNVKVELDQALLQPGGSELVQSALSKIEDFIYYVEIAEDNSKTIRYLSPQLEDVLGIERKEYIRDATVTIDRCHPEDLPGVYESARQLRVNKKPVSFVYRFLHGKKKEYTWIEETVYPQFDSSGRFHASLGIIRDVNDRVIAERALEESRRALENVLDNIEEAVYHMDLSMPTGERLRFVSDSATKIFGLPKEEMFRNKDAFLKYYHPEDLEKVKVTSEKLETEKTAQNYFYRFRHPKTDSYIWIEERVFPTFDEEGRLKEVFGVVRDATAQKKFEQELIDSREGYRTLIEENPEGVVIAGLDQKIIFANKATLEITGIPDPAELIGKSLMEFLTPRQRQHSAERIKALAGGGKVPYEIIEIQYNDGNIVECESRPSLFNYMGQPAILVFLRSITAERLLEKEQLRAQIAEETNLRLQLEIDERIRTEKELYATQKNLRLLIDSSLDMICASDPEGYITEFNQAAQETFGYTKEEVLGKHVSFLYENPDERISVMNKLIEGRGFFSGEVINKKKNGETFTALLAASILKDDNGNVIGSMGVSRDISERKTAEQELRLSEEKYRAIYDQAYIGIALVSTEDDRFIQVNQRLSDMLGYPAEELCTKAVHDLRLPGDLSRLPSGKDFIRRGFERIIDEHRYRHKNGNEVIVNVTISLVKAADQSPLYFVYVYEDLTPKRRAEEQIHRQAAKLNSIFESSSHMIWTIDTNHRLTSFNRNLAENLRHHYGVNAYIGMSMNSGRMVSTSDYNSFWEERVHDAFSGNAQQFETSLVNPAGETSWMEIFLNPIYDENDRVVEVSAIAHDVTDKRQADENLRQSLKEKEVLLKEVHHRVKNNLQVISSILNLQSSYVKDKRILEILVESQNRIKSMAFVHESLYQTKDFSNISFQEYVGNICRNLVHSYSSSENPPELRLDLDPVQLHLDIAIPCGLIINELLSNALKYAFPGGKAGVIAISIKNKAGKITITISDDGVGLPPGFDFRNTESLGLQLVVSLVEQINGKIKADTKKGTKFVIEFAV